MQFESSRSDNSGKLVGNKRYLHVDALPRAADGQEAQALLAAVARAEALAGVRRGEHFNLVRIDADGAELALVHYPGFVGEPFPALAQSWRVDLAAGTLSHRTYADSLNPPILHRKELLLAADDPRRAAWAELTAACESVGLFDDPRRIGYKRQWEQLVRERGYRLMDHALVPIGNDEATDEAADGAPGTSTGPAGRSAARHRTALSRYGFSAPIQSLARNGLLDGTHSLFDYGCGRGDDLRGLRENGVDAQGWDPYFAPDEPVVGADIVNLGFVINVIEDFDERLEALTRAWSLARKLLVVSVMLANHNDPRGERFRDGVMTRRGTFQKYYTQAEIKAFLEEVLDEEAIPVGPGVHYIFRDKDAEQRLLVNRYRSRRNLLRLPPRSPAEHRERPRRDRAAEKYRAHQQELERLWALRLDSGRDPDKTETPDQLALTEAFGSVPKALRFIVAQKIADLGEEAVRAMLERSVKARLDDLLVYFALDQFGRRKPYKHLESGLKRDIKAFFGDYAQARAQGLAMLMQIADVDAIEQACLTAAEHGLGWLAQRDQDADEPGGDAERGQEDGSTSRPRAKSLTLGSGLVDRLPALLRTYIGAASAAYGDYQNADLLKIHIGSGKLTLMRFDDFHGQALPRMLERVKIKLREQDVELYSYGGDYPPPYLYWKSRYLNEEDPSYPDQIAFDESLDGLGLFDLSGFGPPPAALEATLRRHRWQIDRFTLRRGHWKPDLDDPCGRFLTYRDLIECGETQHATEIPNLPEQIESYDALLALAENVLDPVIDWFGMIRLTFGFCSPALARKIPGRIDPKRDQHAAHECNRLGKLVCDRLGAAADFLVTDEDMLDVARWVVENTRFDRLYFYGKNLPIHVSFHPAPKGQVVLMKQTKAGSLVPRVITKEAFKSSA
ncbi:DNA phosphorothioation-associated putative methyltransferase [uncultured Thiohalocapsa sp.]|uniref:DNA phosphorothioation-associated putative methyltransferase n=1 Tax=uncultured Thiohalocapsa sp. TaxID=768990 RepID=UPI0025FC08C7|nr:DNA phosphorothioation-associated putative methyltransferase [uncultured Thiohalocapsa sp.]